MINFRVSLRQAAARQRLILLAIRCQAAIHASSCVVAQAQVLRKLISSPATAFPIVFDVIYYARAATRQDDCNIVYERCGASMPLARPLN